MRYCLSFLFVALISCQKERAISDYDISDFTEVQGMVIDSKEVTNFLDESTWNISYVFKFKNRTYNGKSKDFNIPMSTAQTIIVLVNKENPEINFFKEIGVLTQ